MEAYINACNGQVMPTVRKSTFPDIQFRRYGERQMRISTEHPVSASAKPMEVCGAQLLNPFVHYILTLRADRFYHPVAILSFGWVKTNLLVLLRGLTFLRWSRRWGRYRIFPAFAYSIRGYGTLFLNRARNVDRPESLTRMAELNLDVSLHQHGNHSLTRV